MITAAVLCGASALPLAAANPDPGAIDLGQFTPSSDGGQFVEVKIQSNLIGLVAKLARQAEPEVADLLGSLRSIRVNVIGLGDDNRSAVTKKIQDLRSQLGRDGWDRIVTVQEKDQDVGVYVKLRGQEAFEGIVVTVLDGDKEAVLINVAGDLPPEKLSLIGERFNLEPLKKAGEALKKS
jgi:hypothetical protein